MDIKEANHLLKAKFEIKLPSARRLRKLSVLGAEGYAQLDEFEVVDVLTDQFVLQGMLLPQKILPKSHLRRHRLEIQYPISWKHLEN
jgi:hypothetical protein